MATPRTSAALMTTAVLVAAAALTAVRWAAPAAAAPASVVRYSGNDRYATAAAVSRATFAPGVPAAFVATGTNFPDAMAAGAAAAALGGPVLLTRPDALPGATAAELDRLDPATVYVLGGTGAVSAAVAASVRAYSPTVRRLQGPDRYATATAASALAFPVGASVALVASGRSWPDAISGGAAAGLLGGPVLLTEPAHLSGATAAELDRLKPDRIVVLGGTGAVSAAVADALQAYAPTVDRVAGADRYETSAEVASLLFPAATRPVWLATGADFPDGLAAAAAAAVDAAPVLLTPPSCLPPPTRAAAQRFDPGRSVLLGGPRVLSRAVGLLEPCPQLAGVRLRAQVAFSAAAPVQVVPRPGSPDLFVAERAGTVRRVVSDVVQSTPYLSLDGLTTTGEGGLLGLAFDPVGEWLYTYTTVPRDDGGVDIEIWAHPAGATSAGAGHRILVVPHPGRTNHVSGALGFGPEGDLWIATGDSGGSYDADDRAADVRYLLGKLLRITPTPAAAVPYAVPTANPWAGGSRCSGRSVASAQPCPEIWSYGFRNPYRMSFDPASGELWLPDVGQNAREEVNLLLPGDGRGRSYGWDYIEGDLRVKAGGPATPVPPLYVYRHTGSSHTGCSVIGGVVHRGEIAGLRGAYVFGDFCAPQLWALEQQGGRLVRAVPLGVDVPSLVGFGEDNAGRLYAVSLAGPVYRLTG